MKFNKKFKKSILVFILLLLVFFVMPGITSAQAEEETNILFQGLGYASNAISTFLTWVTLGLASLAGMLLTVATGIVNWLFGWQNFDASGAVTQGWVIVRDVCNMSFILVLLVIAFATILHMENYSMKKYLPKLLLMAVLINFSKTICFFLIDISQVVMLTFGNAFTGASGNFVTMLHVDDMLAITDNANITNMSWNMFFAAGLALLFMVIAFFIMVMMIGILVMRMIMFWVLIVLSPIAFLGLAIPNGGKYWSQWWGEFSKYLTVGPVLAFFTWLSLTVTSTINDYGLGDGKNMTDIEAKGFITKIASEGGIEGFIIGIGLLIGTMKITKSIGAMGAGVGAAWADKAKSKGMGWGKAIATSPLSTGVGMVATGLSNRSWVKNSLGRAGSVSAVPFIGNIATKTLIGLNSRQKKEEEKAKNFVGSIKDTRILERLANQNTYASPWRSAVKDAAASKAPSQSRNVQTAYNRAGKDAFQNWSENEWARLRQGGVDFRGNSQAFGYMQRDHSVRGAVNATVTPGGPIYYGMDRSGVEYTGPARTAVPAGMTPNIGGSAGLPYSLPTNLNAYKKNKRRNINEYDKDEVVQKDLVERRNKRGAGNLSVNSFVRNDENNEIAVDFNAMNLDELREGIKGEFSDIDGVNIIDPEKIKKASEKMVQIIDKEMEKISIEPKMSDGKKSRMENLKIARNKLEKPENFKNLSLINSGAKGYLSLQEVKDTLIHERVHGFGLRDEAQTERVVRDTIQTRKYSEMKDKVNEGMVTRPIKEIVDNEYGQVDSIPQTKEVIKEKETIREIVKSDSQVNGVFGNIGSAKYANLLYAFKFLTKEIMKLNNSQSNLYKKVANLNLKGEPTKIELKLAVDQIKKELDA